MPQNVDFLPEDYVERRSQQRTAIVFIVLFVLAMGGILATYMQAQKGPRKAQAENEQVNRTYEEVSKRLAQLQELDHEKQRMMTKAEVSAVLMERVPRSRLLMELTTLMPKGASLAVLELKSRELQQAPATKVDQAKEGTKAEPKIVQREVTVSLTGLAQTDGQVATFIAALGKSPILSDVNLLSSEEFKAHDSDKMIRQFKVDMKINPNADLSASTDGTSAPGAK
jgi:Tfp pilus assembly protein PilN